MKVFEMGHPLFNRHATRYFKKKILRDGTLSVESLLSPTSTRFYIEPFEMGQFELGQLIFHFCSTGILNSMKKPFDMRR